MRALARTPDRRETDSLFRATELDTRPILLLFGEYATLITAKVNSVTTPQI
jgi:hypothetical protein